MRKKLLIIENDHEIREVVKYIFEAEGYDIIGIDNCSTAELALHNPHLILLDEWVNKVEGTMLCKEIKTIHNIKHVPVIILSTSPQIEKIAEECNADGFISKPFDVDALINTVKACLEYYDSSATAG